jgi:L-lactate dehydrogenase complex protein LldG
MSTRDTILQRVRTALSKGPAVAPPPAPEVWPRLNPAPTAMAEQFQESLVAVQGEVVRCATIDEAGRTLAELARKQSWTSVGAMDRPLVREAVGGLSTDALHWISPEWTPRQMADLSVSVIEPDMLLADTGSCLIDCATAQDRLLCYLPPACVVVARVGQLVEHLPAAWTEIAPRVADSTERGEFVIVTGPSRTADIEKFLILGVHGPKQLIVLLVG